MRSPFGRAAWLLAAAASVSFLLASAGGAPRAKNVILMVADGSGFNAWRAASMYQGRAGKQVYDGPQWIRMAVSTFPLTRATKPGGAEDQDPKLVYGPAKAWDASAITLLPAESKAGSGPFAAYRFLKTTCTDSAAAATAMASGAKTYDNAINFNNLGKPLAGRTIAELSHQAGKAVGVVTSVPWSHATPAALGGSHNVSRQNLAAIANEMLDSPTLTVIMGCGNPDFDADGRPVPDPKPDPADAVKASAKTTSQATKKSTVKKKDFQYVGGQATWARLRAGTHPGGWRLIQAKSDFEAIAAGEPPSRVLGTAQVAGTLQQARGKRPAKGPIPEPFAMPLNRNVPDLATLTRAAMNCLDDDPDGFYLMIEGGAVDWANHANQPERMIEEQIDFLKAVETVCAWIEAHGGWEQTLLILTADHETGMLWGPRSDRVAFDPIVDRGPGKMPGLKYNYNSHTNSLVPLYARGPGSEGFAPLTRAQDPRVAKEFGVSAGYVANTDVFEVMRAALQPAQPAAK